jgi:hypothetical protein
MTDTLLQKLMTGWFINLYAIIVTQNCLWGRFMGTRVHNHDNIKTINFVFPSVRME